MTLQEEQAPIDRAIVVALIEAVPEHWRAIKMDVVRFDDGINETMEIEISSPEGFDEAIISTEKLYEALYALSDCFSSYGRNWKKLIYMIEMDKSENWKFRSNYEY